VSYSCARLPQEDRVVEEVIPSLCTIKVTVFWDLAPYRPFIDVSEEHTLSIFTVASNRQILSNNTAFHPRRQYCSLATEVET
jgi:hypothetical protein